MSLDRLLNTNAVTIIEPGSASDGYNGTAPDWDNPDSSTATRGWLTQTSSYEQVGDRDVVVTGWQLFLPAGTAISSAARVVSGTTTYEVDGEPHRAQTPRGAHHVEVNLRIASEVTA